MSTSVRPYNNLNHPHRTQQASDRPHRTIFEVFDLNRLKLKTGYQLADVIQAVDDDLESPEGPNALDSPQSKVDEDLDDELRLRRSRREVSAGSGTETSSDVSSFNVPKECYQRYANSDYHQNLVDWLHRKNASHYSPISPSYQQALLKIQTEELTHGLQVTSGASSCSTRKMRVISASTPLRERAVCQFEYILNYKPNRIPSTFTEVKCSCLKPSGNLIGRRMFECEPLRYQVRVLLFDEECLSFTEHTETIALACIPVLQANVNVDERADVIIPVQAAPDIPT